MPTYIYAYLILLLSACSSCNKKEKPAEPEQPAAITTRVLAEGLQFPWEILWGPDERIWMTERGGRISRVDPSSGNVTPVFTVGDAVSQGEGGLLGMVLHPDFNNNKQVFIAYDYSSNGSYKGKVVRFLYNGQSLTGAVTLIDNIKAAGIHNGCRLAITGDGKLLITTGDASDQSLPQNKTSLNGKILRINLDGSIPSDNPIPGSPVWTLGHRNPQGLVIANGITYSAEHGPESDDEVNIIEKGRNYGWPTVRGFCDDGDEQAFCTANQIKEPIQNWSPTVAVSGLDFYQGDLIPQWKNSLLLCTLKGSRLLQLKLNDTHNQVTESNAFLEGEFGRLRDVCISPDGKVYVCTSNGNNDKIVELSKGAE